jgi:glycosyltransferase involved in cell wall biosynthesis
MTGRDAIVPTTSAARPAVSVIVPALNSARTIERCMQAVAVQHTDHRFEVLVVHSGEDDTCARAERALPGTRTVQLPRRALAATARNAGVCAARADVFAFLDSDAYPTPEWIEAVVAASRTGYDLVCGAIGNANPDSHVSRAEQLLMFSEFLRESPERPIWFALSGNLVLTRQTYERFGPFVEVRASEDILYSGGVVAKGGRILFFPRLHVLHDNRQSLRPYLRNQVLLGQYTAMARRRVRFADSSSRALFLAALPLSPLVKLAKVVWRLRRWAPGELTTLMREAPLVLLGVLAHGTGQARGAFRRFPDRLGRQSGSTDGGGDGAPVGDDGDGNPPASYAPMSGTSLFHGRWTPAP